MPTPLKTIRKRRKLRQVDLARLSGVNQCTVSRLEAGMIQRPSWDTVSKIADALNLKPSAIDFGAAA